MATIVVCNLLKKNITQNICPNLDLVLRNDLELMFPNWK